MPLAVQAGGTAATEPPSSAHGECTLHVNNVIVDARGAAVVVAVDGAEAKAVLVDSLVVTSDGIAFGKSVEFKLQLVQLKG